MAEFLGSASPTQLLLCMAGPIIGATILVGFLFISISRRTKKEPVNPGSQSNTSLAGNTSTPLPPESTPALETIFFPKNELSHSESITYPASASELDLNLDLLRPQVEMEVNMMNSSQSPYERKAGLSARLANRSQPAPAPPKPEVKQDRTPGQAAPNLSAQPANNKPVNQVAPAEPVELLRLLREPQSGQLIIEIAGRRYTRLAEITDKEIGQYILKLAAHLLAFTNGMIATDAGLKSVSTPKVGQTPIPLTAPTPSSQLSNQPTQVDSSQPAGQPAVPPPPPAAEAAFLASLQAKPVAVEPPQRRGLFGRSKPAPQAEPLLPTLNLAEQINEIAQTRLRYSPLASTVNLEITSDPGGGIRINVNGKVYHGPDDIPQPEVKELIKASIKEWERS